MAFLSKCEKIRLIMVVILGLLATSAFFIPIDFCMRYRELCTEFEILRHFDKVFHFLFFSSLSLIVPFPRRIVGVFLVIIALFFCATAIEGIQYFVPDRAASLQDFIANMMGVFYGLSVRLLQPTRAKGV